MNLQNTDIFKRYNPDKQVEKYSFSLQACIGKGSSGRVYAGTDTKSGNYVAIKVIEIESLKTDYAWKQLCSEVRIMKRLQHKNIVRLLDVFQTKNNAYIISEYCNQGDLRQYLEKKKAIEYKESIKIIKDIVCGLKELSTHGIIHRDIKPANILVHDGIFKITDFGFARSLKNFSDELMDSLVGTPLYMAPQILHKQQYSSKCDVFSLGLLFFELLFSQTPWPSSNLIDLIGKITKDPLVFPKHPVIPKDLEQIIRRCLSLEEKERPSSFELYDFFNEDILNSSKIDGMNQFNQQELIDITSPQSKNSPQPKESPENSYKLAKKGQYSTYKKAIEVQTPNLPLFSLSPLDTPKEKEFNIFQNTVSPPSSFLQNYQCTFLKHASAQEYPSHRIGTPKNITEDFKVPLRTQKAVSTDESILSKPNEKIENKVSKNNSALNLKSQFIQSLKAKISSFVLVPDQNKSNQQKVQNQSDKQTFSSVMHCDQNQLQKIIEKDPIIESDQGNLASDITIQQQQPLVPIENFPQNQNIHQNLLVKEEEQTNSENQIFLQQEASSPSHQKLNSKIEFSDLKEYIQEDDKEEEEELSSQEELKSKVELQSKKESFSKNQETEEPIEEIQISWGSNEEHSTQNNSLRIKANLSETKNNIKESESTTGTIKFLPSILCSRTQSLQNQKEISRLSTKEKNLVQTERKHSQIRSESENQKYLHSYRMHKTNENIPSHSPSFQEKEQSHFEKHLKKYTIAVSSSDQKVIQFPLSSVSKQNQEKSPTKDRILSNKSKLIIEKLESLKQISKKSNAVENQKQLPQPFNLEKKILIDEQECDFNCSEQIEYHVKFIKFIHNLLLKLQCDQNSKEEEEFSIEGLKLQLLMSKHEIIYTIEILQQLNNPNTIFSEIAGFSHYQKSNQFQTQQMELRTLLNQSTQIFQQMNQQLMNDANSLLKKDYFFKQVSNHNKEIEQMIASFNNNSSSPQCKNKEDDQHKNNNDHNHDSNKNNGQINLLFNIYSNIKEVVRQLHKKMQQDHQIIVMINQLIDYLQIIKSMISQKNSNYLILTDPLSRQKYSFLSSKQQQLITQQDNESMVKQINKQLLMYDIILNSSQ